MVYTLQKINRESAFIVNETGTRVAWGFEIAAGTKWVVFSAFHQFLFECESRDSIISSFIDPKNHRNWRPENFEKPVFELKKAHHKSHYIVSESGFKVAQAFQNEGKKWDVFTMYPRIYLFTSESLNEVLSDYMLPDNFWRLFPLYSVGDREKL